METISWEKLQDENLAAMTDAERAQYEASAIESDARLRLADLVYNARKAAGMSQVELAKRAGTSQSVVSAIENAAQVPGGVMLDRMATALGGSLTITPTA
jgi:ribosome-binding protein aMBF1 (putative translation factor)